MKIQLKQVLARWILGQSNFLDYPKLDHLLSVAAEYAGTKPLVKEDCNVSFNCVETRCSRPENLLGKNSRNLLSKNTRQNYRIKRILNRSNSVRAYIENPCSIDILLPNNQKVTLKPDFLLVTQPYSIVFLEVGREPLPSLPNEAQQALNMAGCRYLIIHPRQVVTK